MTICIDPKEVRSSLALWGTPIFESASLSGGGPDSVVSSSKNPGGVGGNCLHAMAITPKLTAPSDSKASLGHLGVCRVAAHSFQGSGSSPGFPASCAGFEEVTGSSSITSNMEASVRSSFSMRGMRHLQRSWTVLQSIPGGTPDCMVHHWRAQASATVLSLHTMQMSLGPCILGDDEGRKSGHPKPARLRGAVHQASFSSWAVGSQSCSLLSCQLFYLSITVGLSSLMAERPEFLPPAG